MNLYIHGTGLISAAGTNASGDFLQSRPDYYTDRLLSMEPDYSTYITPMQLRRMSKAVRMGIGAARICMQHSGVSQPDAISVGTAFGCLYDTEMFLSKMVDQEEQMLTPTAFIQSTHNTVAGQIALLTGCHGHNLTYVHRGHSFEHAMLNAQLYLNDHPGHTMLAGAVEELTPVSTEVLQYAGVYRKELSVFKSALTGAQDGGIAGEGASFFLVSNEQKHPADLKLKSIVTFTAGNADAAYERLIQRFSTLGLVSDQVDLVLMGMSGDRYYAPFYDQVQNQFFPAAGLACFKHLSGEYPVAGAFGLGLLVHCLEKGLPDFVYNRLPEREIRNILLINNFLHHFSCWLLEIPTR